MVKVDVFVLRERPYDREAFARRRRETMGEGEALREFFLSAPEDVVLSKLDWFRRGGETSERQWNDVLGVLRVSGGSLDAAYTERWARELGISDLLARARAEASA